MPKLFLKAEPGAILANDTLVSLVRGWPRLTEKTVAGIHFVQEIRLTRSGELSPTGWGRWADGGYAPVHRVIRMVASAQANSGQHGWVLPGLAPKMPE